MRKTVSMLLAALAASSVDAMAAGRRTGPPVNAFGWPVRDSAGGPIVYGRAELSGRSAWSIGGTQHQILALPAVSARSGFFAAFGEGIGLSSIVISNGEVYAGGGLSTFGANDYWYTLRYTGRRTGYEQTFISRRLPGIVRIGVADVIGDSGQEVVVATEDGRVALYDQQSKAELPGLITTAADVTGMALRDLTGDGKAEILLVTVPYWSNTLHVIAGDGSSLWSLPEGGGWDVIVGQMDADSSLEIATTSGSVIDWDTKTTQWQRAQGFGRRLASADIDGDGKGELIAAESWDFVWSFDVDRQLPKWSIPVDHDIGAIQVANVDADPTLELLVGEGQWGEIIAFDTVTQAREWGIANPEHGVTNVAVGDVDGNGRLEVVWGAGASSTGEDHFYVASLATRRILWQNVHLDGPFLPPQQGDLDGDGRPELVTASFESDAGYDSGRIVVLDGETLRLRAISPPIVGNLAWTGLHDLRLRNVDADSQLEIVVAADRLYDGVIEIYDFAGGSFSLKWTNATRPDGASFRAVEVADIDADGALEVIGGVGQEHSGAEGTFIYVYDYATGMQEWRTFHLDGFEVAGLVVLGQGGGVADIVAMVPGQSLHFFDGTGEIQAIVEGDFRFLGPNGVAAGRSFLTGMQDGTVLQYDRSGKSYSATWTRDLGASHIDGVSLLAGGRMSALSTDGSRCIPRAMRLRRG